MPWRRTLAVAATVLTLIATSATPQTTERTVPGIGPGNFLVVDQEKLFTNSRFGQRILADVEAATSELVAENTQIENALIAEETALTEQRPELAADQFRQLADAFDEKVQIVRAEQSQKSDDIGGRLNQARREFFQAIVPVLAEILREKLAVAILDKRTVLISVNLIDVTDLAVARIDARLGEGNIQGGEN